MLAQSMTYAGKIVILAISKDYNGYHTDYGLETTLGTFRITGLKQSELETFGDEIVALQGQLTGTALRVTCSLGGLNPHFSGKEK